MEGAGQSQSDKRTEREHFFGSAKIVAGLTVISRVFGMLRDMAVVSLGATRATDAFWMAFQIPNLFRRLFGEGALASAFVPVFTEAQEKSGFEKARLLLSNAMGLLAVFLLGLMLVIMLGLLAWGMLCPGTWDRQLLLGLLAVMLPFMVSICLLALGSAALNCRGHFFFPALAPMFLNICMIAAAWWVVPLWRASLLARTVLDVDPRVVAQSLVGLAGAALCPGAGAAMLPSAALLPRAVAVIHPWPLYVIAASVAFAGLMQLAGLAWFLRRGGFRLRPFLRPIEPGIGPMLKLMLPMLLGLGFLQFSAFFDSVIAWLLTATADSPTFNLFGLSLAKPLTDGVITRINAAQRLYQFPMGVLAISLGVAVFPLMARYAARGDLPGLRDAVNRALRLALMEGLATGVGLWVLSEPITRLIYLRGRFTPEDARMSGFILQMYVLGMWAYCTTQILTRSFYALKDTVTPLKVSCSVVVLNIALVVALVWAPQLGGGAFGLATAITASLNCLILIFLLRKRLGLLGGRAIARSLGRMILACAAMAAAVLLARHQMAGLADWKVVAVGVPVGSAVFLIAAKLLKAPELRELFQRGR